MKILVTGSNGFIAKNLIAELKNIRDGKNKLRKVIIDEIFEYDKESSVDLLDYYCQKADFVFHLAGVNRPKNEDEFMDGNFGFTSQLLSLLKKHQNTAPVMISSSIQVTKTNLYKEFDEVKKSNLNKYANSKRAAENYLFEYSKQMNSKALVYRFPNVFGKWCRPNYNSVVATFCHNITHDLPIKVNDKEVMMNLVYIDDVVYELINALEGKENRVGKFCEVPVVYNIKLAQIVDLLYSFKMSRDDRSIPNTSDLFTKKLYSTYLSYLPKDKFIYDLKMNVDERGSFSEFIKTKDRGQVSVNVSKPHIIKGNHWHHTKNEKFLVVSGTGVIRFRKIDEDEVIEYFVSGDKMQVIDIPVGYTHNIENLGDSDMVTIMWVNEIFDADKPDTYYLEV